MNVLTSAAAGRTIVKRLIVRVHEYEALSGFFMT